MRKISVFAVSCAAGLLLSACGSSSSSGIMAAIHAMGNGKYTLKAVRRGTNGWGKAGVNDTTAPF